MQKIMLKMWKHKIGKNPIGFVVILCLCLFVSSLPLQVSAKEDTEAGSKTAENTGSSGYPTVEEYISGSRNDATTELEEADYITVYVQSESELLELAENCRLDSWSKGKKVELLEDIELKDADIVIPVFAGIFEGNGHSISGVGLDARGDDMGLIRYLQTGGVVRNLTVNGKGLQKNGQSAMGGIVGRNYGTIENCTFQGLLEGDTGIGGIAGVNESVGQIIDCKNEGVIIGYHSAGGIVGDNHGSVEGCENVGAVNTYLNEVALDLENLTLEKLEEINSTENWSAHIDAGGIAGISDGWIEDCVNSGAIGYEHVGYNIGGIVGRMQQGTVRNCENTGFVQGRKDVGGIAGQMEPFMQIEYMNDKMNELDAELDEMLDLMEQLTQQLGETGDEASVYTKNITANLRTATAATSNLKNIAIHLWNVYNGEMTALSKEMEQFQKDTEEWRDSLDDNSDENGNDTDVSGGDVSGGDIGGWDDIFGEDWRDNDDALEYVETVTKFIGNSGKHLQNITSASGAQTGAITNNLNILDTATTAAVNDMDALSLLLEGKGAEIEKTTDQISEQAKLLRQLTSEIRDDLFAQEETVIEDASEQESLAETQEIKQGLLEQCINLGNVQADTCVGGIVGQISLEYDLDPEEDIEVKGDVTTEEITSVRAVVRQCNNKGTVTAKKDYAGGITGKANYGTLYGCQNYGMAESTGGGMVGGVAGYFGGTIRGCYALCEVRGNKQVGGIAGIGKHILYSVSMAQIICDGKEIGSIAGKLLEEGVLYGNCFVDEGAGGVDSINYYGGAMSVPYGELRQMEGIPEAFSCFTVSFIIGGTEVLRLQCNYGDCISESQLPEIPQKEGYYGQWPDEDLQRITGNKRIEAQYLLWATSLLSKEKDGNGKEKLLVEGEFLPGYTLEYDEEAGAFCITDGKTEYTGPVTVRYLMEDTEKEWLIKVWKDNSFVPVENRRMGSYLVFDMENPGKFTAEEVEGTDFGIYLPWIAGGIGSAVLAVAVILVVRKLLRKKK